MVKLTAEESPVFEPRGVHAELYVDAGYFSRVAGVAKEWFWQPLSASVGENEVRYISHFRSQRDRGVYGILYVLDPPGLRLDAMVGALVRNFIDARLRMLHEALGDPDTRSCSALFIPDFCLGPSQVFQSVAADAYALLLDRFHAGRQTVLFTASASAVRSAYGDMVETHLRENFLSDPR